MWNAYAEGHDVILKEYASGVDVRLDPYEAMELAERLLASGRSAAKDVLDDVRRGDCAMCGNTRMVEVPRSGGHMMREHCPACAVRAPIPHVLPSEIASR